MWLHTLTVLFIVAAALGTEQLFVGSIAGWGPGVSLLLWMLLSWTNKLPRGHGVDGTRHIHGLTPQLYAIYAFVLLVALFFALKPWTSVAYTTAIHLTVLGCLVLYGWLAGLANWYFGAQMQTFYASEAIDRKVLKSCNYNASEVEGLIKVQKAKGRYGPPASKPHRKQTQPQA